MNINFEREYQLHDVKGDSKVYQKKAVEGRRSLAEFLTLCPLYPLSPLPVARSVKEVQISGRGPFLTWG